MPKRFDYMAAPSGIFTVLESDEGRHIMNELFHIGSRVRQFSTEEMIDLMDESGIDIANIIGTTIRTFKTNRPLVTTSWRDVAKVLDKHPDRFVGTFPVDPSRKMELVREIEQVVKDYRFVGVFVNPYGWNTPINSRDLWPLYAKCEELGLAVIVQIGHTASFGPSACGQPILMDDIALYFNDLKILGAHTGWPWVEEAIAMAWKHPNVYIGTSTWPPKRWSPALVDFMNTRGKGKVVFGTGFPIVHWKDALAQIKQLGLTPEAEEQLLGGAAEKVFKV